MALLLSLMVNIQTGEANDTIVYSKRSRRINKQLRVDHSIPAKEETPTNLEDPKENKEVLSRLISTLISKGEKLLGKPYRAKGIAPWALDCSGYICYLYKQLGLAIPRSSTALSSYTERIDEPQAGDLLFFRGRNASAKRVGHVALVVSNHDGDPIIMHSTTSRGVIKHRLSKDAYFRKRYLFAGRLPQISEMLRTDDSCDNI